MQIRLRSALVAALAATGAATLAACGPTSASTASSSTTTKAAANAGSGSKAQDGLGHPVNVCQLLPAATVSQITGKSLTVPKEDDTVSYKIYVCDYDNSTGTDGVRVTVLADQAKAGYDAALKANGAGAHQISGVGDKAFSAITGVQALFGDVSITVSNLTSDDAAVQIIRTLQPKL